MRRGWRGGKHHDVYKSKIHFNVVRKECDITNIHLQRWALREVEKGMTHKQLL